MGILDVIIILLILMFGVVGFKKGIIKESVSLVGIILVFIISYMFKGYIGDWLCKFLPFFEFSGKLEGLVSLNILIYQLVGFFLLFSILYGLYNLIMFFTKILQKIIDITLILTIPSKIAGFFIGLLKGYLIVLVGLLILVIPINSLDIFKDSFLRDLILYKTPIVSSYTKDITSSIKEVRDLVILINNEEISLNEANIRLLKSMIKYNVVDTHTVEQIIVLDKLDSVKNVENVLDN